MDDIEELKKFYEKHKVVKRLYLTGEIKTKDGGFAKDWHEAIDDPKVDEIDIFVCSYGGSLMVSLSIYDLIRQGESKKDGKMIKVAGSGCVHSGGLLVFMAVDNRVAFRNTSFLLHYASGWTYGPMDEKKVEIEHFKRYQDIMFDLARKRTSIPKKLIKEASTKNIWFDAKQALKWKVIDAIISTGD